MKAVVYDRYGSPDVLRISDVPEPVPLDDELLVKVHATTVNRTECGLRAAKPFITRYFTGLRRPKRPILGMEFAGRVEAVLVESLIESGEYRPVIDRTYRLEDVVEATTYVETGQKTGNVVLTVNGRSR